jgi:hypothetical protein
VTTSTDKPVVTQTVVTPRPKPPDKELYDVINFIIVDKNIDMRLRLMSHSENNLSADDNIFLEERVYEEPNSLENDRSIISEINSSQNNTRISAKDKDHILRQKKTLKDFVWDNGRLGFSNHDTSDYYIFSPPLFSCDSTIAFVRIHYICKPFLCGTDQVYALTKKDGHWTSKVETFHIH